MAVARLNLSAARLCYTLRQRTLPSFTGKVAAMFGKDGGYLMPMNPPVSCKRTAWMPEACQ